jgi:transposase
MTKTSSKYSPEVRARAVRMVQEHAGDHPSEWAAISSIAGKIGCTPETLRTWVRKAERDAGTRPGLTSDERARLKALERENRELRQANEILRKGEAIFRHWSEDNGRALFSLRRSSFGGALEPMALRRLTPLRT